MGGSCSGKGLRTVIGADRILFACVPIVACTEKGLTSLEGDSRITSPMPKLVNVDWSLINVHWNECWIVYL